MLDDTADIERESQPEAPKAAGRKVRLLTLDDLDKRTTAARVACQTRDQVCADLGGADRLTTLELIQVDSVSVTAAMLADLRTRWLKGEEVDIGVVATLQNAFNRTAASLGFKRRARDVSPTLSEYLAAKKAHAA